MKCAFSQFSLLTFVILLHISPLITPKYYMVVIFDVIQNTSLNIAVGLVMPQVQIYP